MTQAFDVAAYWDRRYRDGRSSGAGSEGAEGFYKAEYVTDFIHEYRVVSMVDWGVGDGQVLAQMDFPEHFIYHGVDVSQTIVDRMKKRFPNHEFGTVYEYRRTIPFPVYAASLSMDVLFHFPDDNDYCQYLAHLFSSAAQYVIIYSTNYDGGRTSRHVMRREFTRDVAVLHPEWKLVKIESPLKDGLASFFVYEKVT